MKQTPLKPTNSQIWQALLGLCTEVGFAMLLIVLLCALAFLFGRTLA